jgi:hypothetical protein
MYMWSATTVAESDSSTTSSIAVTRSSRSNRVCTRLCRLRRLATANFGTLILGLSTRRWTSAWEAGWAERQITCTPYDSRANAMVSFAIVRSPVDSKLGSLDSRNVAVR